MLCEDELFCLLFLHVVLQKCKKNKNILILKLGKSKLLAEALHMIVSQSALESLAESCSNIENGESCMCSFLFQNMTVW